MKLRKIYFLVLGVLLSACVADRDNEGVTPDGESVGTPSLKCSTMAADPLATPSPDNTALTVAWTNGNISGHTVLALSPDKNFQNSYTESFDLAVKERQFTFRELNDIIMSRLGMEAGIQAPLYIQVSALVGEAVAMSNVATVLVTPGTVINPAALSCSTSEAVLTSSTPDRLALSLSWTKNGSGVSNSIEMATTQEFYMPYSEKVGDGVHDRQYTYGRLNDILVNSLGMTPGEQGHLYIRIVSSYATAAAASNVVTVAVTPEAEATVADVRKLYMCGITSADPWIFDAEIYLVQYNTYSNSYAGVQYADSQWGYKLYPEFGNWDYAYTRASGDAMSGTLMLGTEGNLYAPPAGNLYLFDVSLGNYTYNLTAVNSVSYTGIGDDWNLHPMSQPDRDKPIYTATVTVTKPTTYRWQIIINQDWNLKFCATNGTLRLYDEGNADEQTANGTYTLTVNLASCTYTLTKQ